jgi:hypothetical protein
MKSLFARRISSGTPPPLFLMLPIPLLSVHLRILQSVPELWDPFLAGKPVPEELTGDFEFEGLGAYPTELVGQIRLEGNGFLENLSLPSETVWVIFRVRVLVDQAVGRQTFPFPLTGVFVSLVLNEEKGYSILLYQRLALSGELVRFGVLA